VTNRIPYNRMTYNEQGKRTSLENLAGQVTATAWDGCFAYANNTRSELTNAVAAIDAEYRYAYDFDDIGNRETSSERGTNAVYVANQLNWYCSITTLTSDVGLQTSSFSPQFDDDGNQTLVKTATGIWQVQYNGENRPVLWTLINSSTPNSSTPTLISMSFDRQGRRVTKNNQRFVYDGYLQVASFDVSATNSQLFIWDPTEPVATRPLVWNRSGASSIYTHDGNKNVSEVVDTDKKIEAHYEYAPFGAMSQAVGESAYRNFWRFSSEYADDDTSLIYYNYRHFDSRFARWYRNNGYSLETEGNGGRHFRYVKAR